MAIRVDMAGIQGLMDAVGSGSTGTGLPVVDDGTRSPDWVERPWAGKNEHIASEAMRLMAVPAEEILKTRPPVPYYVFPPNQRFDRNPLTIMDVLDTDRWAPKQRSWVSPDLAPPPRVMTPDSGGGTDRNVSRPGNPFG